MAHVNNKTLGEALDNVLNKVGPTFKRAILDELEREGVRLNDPSTTPGDIEKVLVRTFGQDAASLLMNAILKETKRY